ncbi:glucosyl-dolichyl phosphate glucuronosyltransferase [Methylomarinovum tepidoasis]|uniref:Glucosyl-dolichyl phosphate glucuronosyltransferase n=1 Tax=Methylomarinovum tepidoasis TaxID=2840183 RepID=A0AAU9CGI2_9GAMM|nr:glycosyltransferase [Methylomarinovum sp. IN45]BCX89348.1 glucosyl-dolichyl phosphate glucuronosyltransferase [Methylomarinovum sp. IN45]
MISVIICTHNRGDILGDTLASLVPAVGEAEANGVAVELILIDNHSSDSTGEIGKCFAADHAWARYVFEPETGLSYARNRGIQEARGDILAFADDDVFFDSSWLKALAEAFCTHPDAGCVGGKTIPLFESGEPLWLHEHLLYMYGVTNSGDAICWFEPPKHPYGVNMAFRRHLFERVGLFDPRLGRIGKSLLSGEEADFFKRVYAAGYKVLYTPFAVLWHRIPAARTEKSWVLRRSYWQGISDVVHQQIDSPLSRGSLVSQAARETYDLFHRVKGPSWNPRKIFWHIRELPFYARSWHMAKLGFILQSLREAIRLRPIRVSS